MRKLLIGSAIIFLMIFTAGIATAWQSAPVFPFTANTGTLYFISETGAITSDDTTATITLKQPTVTTGEPTNLFYGTLAFTPAGTLITFDIAATLGQDGTFHITGSSTSPAATLSAQGSIEYQRHSHADRVPSITLGGSIQAGTTFYGRFEGVLSQSQ